jgi:aspartate aminotransferase-like enzyme
MIFGLYEGIRIVLDEGMPRRIARHKDAAEYLIKGLKKFGLSPMVEPQ